MTHPVTCLQFRASLSFFFFGTCVSHDVATIFAMFPLQPAACCEITHTLSYRPLNRRDGAGFDTEVTHETAVKIINLIKNQPQRRRATADVLQLNGCDIRPHGVQQGG